MADPSIGVSVAGSNIGSLVAWWGAGLSTVLALVKLWEVWRDRFRIDISYCFIGDPEQGNEVRIRNLSNRPFILAHWELLYCTGRWPRRKFTDLSSAEFDAADRTVLPQSTHTLNFSEANYFDWGWKSLGGRRIFIRLHIAGRRPILRLLYA